MIQERFTEAERQRLRFMVLEYIARQDKPSGADTRILSLLSGTDTVITAERAYPGYPGHECEQ